MATKLHPFLDIRRPLPEPSHPPFALFATSDEHYSEAKAQGGVNNVIRYRLDRDLTSYYEDSEERKASRNRAIAPAYDIVDQPQYNRASSFESVLTAQEKTQLDAQAAAYKLLRDGLQKEASDSGKPLSEEKQQLLEGYVKIIDICERAPGLISNQIGFVEEIPDIFGYGGTCLHDINNVPNVNKVRVSTFAIPKDHPFHLALRLSVPLEDQRETDFQIQWGPFILRFLQGRAVTLSMYSQKLYANGSEENLKQIAEAQQKLDGLLDQGRLTDVDMAYIAGLNEKNRLLRKEVKDKKLKKEDAAYKEIDKQVDANRALIVARRQLKSRPPGGVQTEIKKQQDLLFDFHDEQINLNEASENFYGDEGIIRLTVLPQRRGYLTFQLKGQEPVTVKIPAILDSKRYGTLWQDTRLLFKSNGGSFDWKVLFPVVKSEGEYRIPNVPVPFVLQPDDLVTYEGDWDENLPGCDIAFAIEQVEGFREEDPRYDFIASFRTNVIPEGAEEEDAIIQEYFPWLYALRFFINAGEIPPSTEVLWSTRDFGVPGGSGVTGKPGLTLNPGYPNPNYDSPIRNITVTLDDVTDGKRGMSYILDINDPMGTIGFPLDGYKNHQIDFTMGIWDSATKTITVDIEDKDVLVNGIIREAVLMNARRLDDTNGIPTTPEQRAEYFGPDAFWRLTVVDLWSAVEDFIIQIDVLLDGLTLAAAWKKCLGLRGFQGDWVQYIEDEGILAGPVLPKPGPGEKPRKCPTKGMSLGYTLRQLLDEFGVTDDDREMRGRIKKGFWCLDVPQETVIKEFSGAANYSGTEPVLAGAQRAQDWSRFRNIFTVEGGRDKKTQERISVTLPIFESMDNPQSPIYWGSPKPADLMRRNDLDTQAEVERAAEIAAIRGCKSGDLRQFGTKWLYPMVPIGDRVRVDNSGEQQPFELARISGMSLDGDTQAAVVLRPVVETPF